MAITWLLFKTLVAEKLGADGDSTVSLLPDVTQAGNATFSARCLLYLQVFSRATYINYSRGVSYVGTAGSMELDLSGQNPPVCEPFAVYVGTSTIPLQRVTYDAMRRDYPYNLVQAGGQKAPTRWSNAVRDSVIEFNSLLDATSAAGIVVEGWTLHPSMTDDAATLSIPDVYADSYATAIAAIFQEGVVADDTGMSRLKYYNKKAYDTLGQIKSRNMSRFYESLARGAGRSPVLYEATPSLY